MLDLIGDLYETGAAARAVTDPIAHAARSARWGVSSVLIGGAGLHREAVAARWGTYVPPSVGTIVGRFLGFETPGDVEVTLDKLDTDMAVFHSELGAAAGATAPNATQRQIAAIARYLHAKDAYAHVGGTTAALLELAAAKQQLDAAGVDAHVDLATQLAQLMTQLAPLERFFLSVWSPFFERWRTFYGKNRAWFANFMRDNRHERDGYLDQLKEFRSTARSLGVAIASPDPTTPKATPYDQLLSFVKILLFGSLFIGGAFVLAMVWRAYRA
jgi:hypothetical protein